MSRILGFVSLAVATLIGSALGAWLFGAPPARALVDTAQILTGANGVGPGTIFIPPSATAFLTEDQATVPFPAGTLSSLRVRLTTQTAPTGGDFSVMVRVNGADTQVTCTLTESGICTSGNKTKGVNNNGLVTLRVNNNLVDAGNTSIAYSLQFD